MVQMLAEQGPREDDPMPAIEGLAEDLNQDAFAADRRLLDPIDPHIDARPMHCSPAVLDLLEGPGPALACSSWASAGHSVPESPRARARS